MHEKRLRKNKPSTHSSSLRQPSCRRGMPVPTDQGAVDISIHDETDNQKFPPPWAGRESQPGRKQKHNGQR
jgi:hypothetical protein